MRSDRIVLSKLKKEKLRASKPGKTLNKLAISYPGLVVTAYLTAPDNMFRVD